MKEFLMYFGLSVTGIILYALITLTGSIVLYKMSNHGEDPSLEDVFCGALVIGSFIFVFLLIYIVVNYVQGPVAQ